MLRGEVDIDFLTVKPRSTAVHVKAQHETLSSRPTDGGIHPNNAQSNSSPLESVRADYLRALEANQEARRRYADAVAEARQATRSPAIDLRSGERTRSVALLDRRREVLRLQRQHARLVGLKDDLEGMKLSQGVTALNITETTVGSDLEHEGREVEIETAKDSVARLISNLEIAVVQARHQAKRQEAILDATRQAQNESSQPDVRKRLTAMLETRHQLTTWLEDSLEKCQAENDEQGEPSARDCSSIDLPSWEHMIDQQYESYLNARERVISLGSAIRAELPDVPGTAAAERPALTERSQSSRDGTSNHGHDVLGLVEQRLIPAREQENVTNAHRTMLQEQQSSQNKNMINMLERLSDESQLLQAFPILAHSGRFKHVTTVMGKVDERSQDELSQWIDPWLFAAEAADISSAATMDMHLKRGTEAMESVSRSLNELRLSRDTSG